MLYLIALLLVLLVIYWFSSRIWRVYTWNKKQKVALFAFICFLWLIPFLLKKQVLPIHCSYSFICHILYFASAFSFFLFGLIVIRDAIWALGWLHEKITAKEPQHFSKNQPLFLKRSNRFFAIIALLLTFHALYAGLTTPAVKETTIYTDKLSSDITIVALNDMHLHHSMSTRKIENIVHQVNRIKPDIVVFGGDFLDDTVSHLHKKLYLISQIEAPLGKFAVAGNHEFYLGLDAAKEAFTEAGISYLSNSGRQITNTLYLAGIPDHKSAEIEDGVFAAARAFSAVQNDSFKLLLTHQPSFIDMLDTDQVDLQISGHTHGGQIFPLHLPVKFINGYLFGLHETPAGLLYVSKGVAQWGPQMRLLARSEISVIHLKATKPSAIDVPQAMNEQTVLPDFKPVTGKEAVAETHDQEETSPVSDEPVLLPLNAFETDQKTTAVPDQTPDMLFKENQTVGEKTDVSDATGVIREIDELIAAIQKKDLEKAVETQIIEELTQPEEDSAVEPTTDEQADKEVVAQAPVQEPEITQIKREELFVEVEKRDGRIALVRVFDGEHRLVADTELRDGKNIQTKIEQFADGETRAVETVMHVRTTTNTHATHTTIKDVQLPAGTATTLPIVESKTVDKPVETPAYTTHRIVPTQMIWRTTYSEPKTVPVYVQAQPSGYAYYPTQQVNAPAYYPVRYYYPVASY